MKIKIRKMIKSKIQIKIRTQARVPPVGAASPAGRPDSDADRTRLLDSRGEVSGHALLRP